MNEQLRFLRRLQQVNDKIQECEDEKAALAAVLERMREESRLHQKEIDELKESIVKAKKMEDHHNLDLKSNEGDINKLLGQLTQAKTNEEYSGIDRRIQEERKQNSALEDTILQIMDDVERMEGRAAALSGGHDAEQKLLADFQAKVAADGGEIDRRIEGHREKAAEIEEAIEPEFIERYHKLFERLNGNVMAPIDHLSGVCLGCNLPVTRQDINLVLADSAVIFCKSCGRILYIPEEA